MDGDYYKRLVQTSVTNFLYHGDNYLFIHKGLHKKIDGGRLNGVGGRVERDENYLDAAIRETEEETGYIVSPEDIQLCGVVRLEGGYKNDWVFCVFKIKVPSKKIPLGSHTEDGELRWIHKDRVLDSDHELVDDIHYFFKDIVEGKIIFFMDAKLDDNQKIVSANISRLIK
jgi:8-oxo-dGTP pyrophosphatase MutT (NUDIX family)